MNNKKYIILLGIIAALALAIRLYMVRAGLPYTYWHDENNYIEMALKLGAGNLKLMSFSHGGLYQIVLFAVYATCYLIAKVFMLVHSPSELYINYLKDPTVFFLIARSLTALSGAGIVVISYLITAKAYNRSAALVASLFTGFSFLMVQMSSLALADIPSVLILLISFLILMHSVEKPKDIKLYCIASLVIGLAAACKYLAIFGVAPLYAAAFMKSSGESNRLKIVARFVIMGSVLVGIGFCIGMPFFLLNLTKFYNDTVVRMGGEYILRNPHKDTWIFYFTNHLRNGLGIPLECTALAGIVYALWRRTKWDLLLVSFPVVYYLFIMNSMGFAYHLLPAIPFLLILAGRLISDIVKKIMPSMLIAGCLLLGLVVLSPSLADAIKYAGIFTSPDTRTIAKEWVEKNIASRDSILAEGYIYTLAVHTPPLIGDSKTLNRDKDFISSKGGTAFSVKTEIEHYGVIHGNARSYDISKVDGLTKEDIDRVRPTHIILSGSNDIGTGKELLYYLSDDYFSKRLALREYIAVKYDLVRSFVPTREFSTSFPHLMDQDYHLVRNLRFNELYNYIKGPKIDIFKIKQEVNP